MNSINHAANQINNGFHKSLEIAAYTINNSEPLEKVVKITERIIRVYGLINGHLSKAFSNLGAQLKDGIVMFETLRFVGLVNGLVVPKNGKYFLTDSAHSWQKRIDRVTAACHCAFKSVKGLARFGFLELGVMAKNVIGKLPIFTLVMDSFMIVSSFFSSWDSLGIALPRSSKKLEEANAKIDKWEYRHTAINLLTIGDEAECIHFYKKYQEKSIKLKLDKEQLQNKISLNELKIKEMHLMKDLPENQCHISRKEQEKILVKCTQETIYLTDQVKKLQSKGFVVNERISKLAKKDFVELANDLKKANNVEFKIRKWNVEKYNAAQEITKIWVRTANAIGKIAVITLALVLTATSLWTMPYLLSLLFLGIAVDSIGLTKILVDEFWKSKPVPRLGQTVLN